VLPLPLEDLESVDRTLPETHSLAFASGTVSNVIVKGFDDCRGEGEGRDLFFGDRAGCKLAAEGAGKRTGGGSICGAAGPGGDGGGLCRVLCKDRVISMSGGCFDRKVAHPRCIELGTGLGGGVGGHSISTDARGVANGIGDDDAAAAAAAVADSGGAGWPRSDIASLTSSPRLDGLLR
jgi:hypothetical protein